VPRQRTFALGAAAGRERTARRRSSAFTEAGSEPVYVDQLGHDLVLRARDREEHRVG
jgi:hypothetical protein